MVKFGIYSRYIIIPSLFRKTLTALKRRENYKNVSKSKWLVFYIFIGKFHWKFSFRKFHHGLLEFMPQNLCNKVIMIQTHRLLEVTIFIEIKGSFFFIYSLHLLQLIQRLQYQQERMKKFFTSI